MNGVGKREPGHMEIQVVRGADHRCEAQGLACCSDTPSALQWSRRIGEPVAGADRSLSRLSCSEGGTDHHGPSRGRRDRTSEVEPQCQQQIPLCCGLEAEADREKVKPTARVAGFAPNGPDRIVGCGARRMQRFRRLEPTIMSVRTRQNCGVNTSIEYLEGPGT